MDRPHPKTAGRRTLTFARLDEVMPDVDRLLDGYSTVGNWSLGQICNHLGMAIRGSIEGFPVKAPWLIRQTMGRIAKRQILTSGRLSEGIKVPEEVLPKPGLDDRAEAEALRTTLQIYSAHSGPMIKHPFLGPLTRDQWTRIHCIHCAHHLSFALPAES